jgi:hypothetical protein
MPEQMKGVEQNGVGPWGKKEYVKLTAKVVFGKNWEKKLLE